jgi:hypothetical protein
MNVLRCLIETPQQQAAFLDAFKRSSWIRYPPDSSCHPRPLSSAGRSTKRGSPLILITQDSTTCWNRRLHVGSGACLKRHSSPNRGGDSALTYVVRNSGQ